MRELPSAWMESLFWKVVSGLGSLIHVELTYSVNSRLIGAQGSPVIPAIPIWYGQ